MKKTDIAMIVLIASVCVLIAFFVTKSVLGSPADKPVSVKTIESINPTLGDIDPTIFNSNAINPAVEVQISQGTK